MRRLKQCVFILFCLAIVVLAVASVLDAVTGQEGLTMAVYHSVPFAAMWGTLAVLGMVYVLRRRLWHAPATLLIHLAFVVILCGAWVTHVWGVQGRLHLREGAVADSFMQEDGTLARLPFRVGLEAFEVQYYPGTSEPMDFVSTMQFDEPGQAGRSARVSMNKIATCQHYRFCQSSYDSDLRGSVLLVSHDPVGIGLTYTGYGLLLLGMMLFWFQRQSQFHRLPRGRFVKGLILVLCVAPLCIDFRPMMTRIIPVLRSPFFPIHVVAISISYALLAYITINGIVALCARDEARQQRLKQRSQLMLYPALFLLTAGIFVGAVWANVSWGRYWGWDSKEVWALIMMMIYSLPLHQQSIPWFARPRNFHLYCVLAIFTVLMTYFGVNYLLVGLHSYA